KCFDFIIPGSSEGFNGPEDVDGIVTYLYMHPHSQDADLFKRLGSVYVAHGTVTDEQIQQNTVYRGGELVEYSSKEQEDRGYGSDSDEAYVSPLETMTPISIEHLWVKKRQYQEQLKKEFDIKDPKVKRHYDKAIP